MSYDAYMMMNTGLEDCSVEYIGNMTSNVSGMWTLALGFPLRQLEGRTGEECIPNLERAVSHIRHPQNVEAYKKLNPPNGWGNHEYAAEYLEKILAACRRHPKAKLHLSH